MAAKPTDYHPQTKFRIEAPTGRSKSYRIRHKSPYTLNKWVAVKCQEIGLVNTQLKSGHLTPEHAKEKLKVILRSLYATRDKTKPRPKFLQSNLDIVDRMWAEKYTARRKRRMKRSNESLTDLKRAAEAAGTLPLDVCDIEDLEEHLDATLGNKPKKHARRIIWLNSILDWLGREKLQTIKDLSRPRVRYLNEEEFAKILPRLKPRDQDLAQIAFYTGLRLGEIFYIQPHHIKPHTLYVELQMTDIKDPVNGGFIVDVTKTRDERDAFLPEKLRPVVARWAAVPLKEREKWRLHSYAKKIRKACEIYSDTAKHLTFHDLRHCNAIWLLRHGASLHEVAQNLGDTLETTERYYSGFALKAESIARLAHIIDSAMPQAQ